jgi:hypothetical protein
MQIARREGLSEARELLAPVYGWLTEGFDPLDVPQIPLDMLGPHRHPVFCFPPVFQRCSPRKKPP